VITADPDGTVRTANHAFLDLLGYSDDDVAAGAIRAPDITPPEYAERDAAARTQLRDTGIIQPREKEYLRKDGSRVPVLIGGAAIDGGELIAFVLDLTGRKRAEEAIRRLEKE